MVVVSKQTDYSASKRSARGFSESLRKELADEIAGDKKELTMPPLARLLPALRVLPTPVFDRVVERFGVNSSMEEFAGRK